MLDSLLMVTVDPDVALSLELVLPEGIKVNAGVCVWEGCGGEYAVLSQAIRTIIQNQN
jgi:hypothetical protein